MVKAINRLHDNNLPEVYETGFCVHQVAKFIHTSSIVRAVDKSQLSKLRKKTGFTFVNCKKALEKFNNDLKKAEEWLRNQAQKEGWAKATKLQGRAIAQGLIGLSFEENAAAMVEVNCETDFVAKNSKFVDLVKAATGASLRYGKNSQREKLLFDSEDLADLLLEKNQQKLSDFVALQIGALGENMAVQRGAFLMVSGDTKIGTYVHAAGPQIHKPDKHCLLGKYAVVVTYTHNPAKDPLIEESLPEKDIGRQLAQHIVGMNPKTIGNMEEFKKAQEKIGKNDDEISVDDNPDSEEHVESSKDEEQPQEEVKYDNDDEDRMIFQDFLVDPSIKVGEYLVEHNIEILDFVRFECGEKLQEE